MLVIGHAIQYPDDEEEDDEEGQTKIVYGSPAEAEEENPGEACPDKAQGEEANAHVKCFCRWQTGLLEEIGCVADEVDPGDDLDAVDPYAMVISGVE